MKEITKEKQVHANHRSRMKNIFVENGFAAFSEIQKFVVFLNTTKRRQSSCAQIT